jgi:hypothetical protein
MSILPQLAEDAEPTCLADPARFFYDPVHLDGNLPNGCYVVLLVGWAPTPGCCVGDRMWTRHAS